MTGRRAWIVAVAMALTAAACTSNGSPKGPTIASLRKGGTEYSLVQAQSNLTVGTGRFVFGLVSRSGQQLVGGAPQVWVASNETSQPLGPFTARWLAWSSPLDDKTATPPVPGFYRADVRVPRPGNWMILAKASGRGVPIVGTAAMPVTNKPVAAIGSKALSEPTPVATTPEEAAKIDTREPPSPLHYVSLDQALTNGRPTVLVFATPLLCQSRMCGPVVDEVIDVYNRVGRTRPTSSTSRSTPSATPTSQRRSSCAGASKVSRGPSSSTSQASFRGGSRDQSRRARSRPCCKPCCPRDSRVVKRRHSRSVAPLLSPPLDCLSRRDEGYQTCS